MLPAISLNPNAELPLYRQLFEKLRDLIQTGQIGRGERLPATRELAGHLGLNRATVSAAYELLESEGLLKGHVGKGSFVGNAPDPRLSWERLLLPSEPLATPTLALGEGGISFAASRPAVDLFPLDDFRAVCQEVLADPSAGAILQLGSPSGFAPLRQYLMDEARRTGDARPSDDIQITSGCQQALDLIQRLLLRPGVTVALEDPVYPGLRSALLASGARLAGIPVGEEGMDLDALEAAIRRDRPQMIVVTPNFQNPTGATMPLAARQRLVRLAREAGAVLIENDIYGPLRYEGEALPTLKQLDESGDVILLGSFSKIAFPGLRIGWAIGPKPFINRLAEAKRWCDLHSDQLSQAVLHRFAESGRLAAHREVVCVEGRTRLKATLEACAGHLPAGSRFTRPQGGMSIWVLLPEPLDSGELLPRAERANVNYLPGRYFAVHRVEPAALRLSFAGVAPGRIRSGIATLGEVFGTELERVRAARRLDPAPALV